MHLLVPLEQLDHWFAVVVLLQVNAGFRAICLDEVVAILEAVCVIKCWRQQIERIYQIVDVNFVHLLVLSLQVLTLHAIVDELLQSLQVCQGILC